MNDFILLNKTTALVQQVQGLPLIEVKTVS